MTYDPRYVGGGVFTPKQGLGDSVQKSPKSRGSWYIYDHLNYCTRTIPGPSIDDQPQLLYLASHSGPGHKSDIESPPLGPDWITTLSKTGSQMDCPSSTDMLLKYADQIIQKIKKQVQR